MSRSIRCLITLATGAVAVLASSSAAAAGTFPLVICGTGARSAGDGLSWSSTKPLTAGPTCPSAGLGLSVYAQSNKTAGRNATGAFAVTAPNGVTIYSIHVLGANAGGMGDTNYYGAHGWWGEFYWNGGPGLAGRSGPLTDAGFNTGGCCSQTNLRSRTVGWFLACNQSSCPTGSAGVALTIGELDLTAEEDRAPTIIASGGDNLWYQSGWVRGRWPASFTASDPSGVCGAAVVFGSLPAILTPTPDTAPNRRTWQQCPQQTVPAAVDTSASDGSLGRGEGAMQLRLTATNSASVTANSTKTVDVDNSTPTISLAGPVDAPSTAGTQYVTATAGGSPSAIADILCTVDGAPAQTFAGASAQVPVSGIGRHTIGCFAEDNAVDSSGAHGRSTTATWSLKIGQPTEVGIAFDKLVGLRCHSARVRVTIPGHWITTRRHGKRVKVKTRARSKLERVQRCHPRTVRRRTVVFVRARRHGHLVKLKRVKYVSVVVPPHVVAERARVVPFGQGTTVNGWLGTSNGTALAGQVVHVLTAPNNGGNAFTEVATVTTTATGSWTARLGSGPSRVVEAVFDGSPTTESSSSGQVRVLVPAVVRIAIRPRIVPWGAELHITGRVLGGYVPTNSNLLRLDVGIGRIGHIEGLPQILASGRFLIVWKFDRGQGVIHPWFSVSTLSEAAFPYSPGTSKRVIVTLGEPTPTAVAAQASFQNET
jgi:hypothetical protein